MSNNASSQSSIDETVGYNMTALNPQEQTSSAVHDDEGNLDEDDGTLLSPVSTLLNEVLITINDNSESNAKTPSNTGEPLETSSSNLMNSKTELKRPVPTLTDEPIYELVASDTEEEAASTGMDASIVCTTVPSTPRDIIMTKMTTVSITVCL